MLSKIHLHNFPIFSFFLQENSLRDLNDVNDIHQKLDTSSTTADLPPPVKLPRTQSSISQKKKKKTTLLLLNLYIHINNGSECTQRARAPTSNNNALVYFTIQQNKRYAISFRIIIHTFKKKLTLQCKMFPKNKTQKMFSLM